MLEAEIRPSGAVHVEGHHVGELLGFRFTPDSSAAGEDAKAVRAAAQKALAGEFEKRAERFASCPNGDLSIGSDGYLRWIGQPVGALTASDDPLAPRVILLTDEQLTGPARDKVAARAERFVGFQTQTLLKPLFDLKAAESLSGIARGIAFRLVEAFGVVERREVAEEVRSLDPESRAGLRRLGVRIGAHHLFVPSLLKPAPAGFATLLWALGHDAREKPGYGEVTAALAAGRTSLTVDPAFEPTFYRLAGFRKLGRRAVRVDILERLADLIRPALSWRKGMGARPEGAFDGNAFMVTPAMMSILGATAEDMEETLKALGYRAEARKAEDVATALAALDAEWRAAEAAKTVAAQAVAAAPPAGEAAEAAPVEAPDEDQTGNADGEDAADVAEETTVADAGDTVVEDVEETTDQSDVVVSEVASEPAAEAPSAGEGESGTGGEEPAEEPKPVLLWRPQRHDHRPHHQRERHHGKRNEGPREETGGPRREREGNEGRGKRPRPGKPPRDDKGPPKRDERGGKPRFEPRREEKPVKLDPDSPFAKLAALREQLKK
jgi:ATP-dependent RNA helicase SUPV3L1/SUV3